MLVSLPASFTPALRRTEDLLTSRYHLDHPTKARLPYLGEWGTMSPMEILGQSLVQLRATRTSQKWRTHPDDVLPVWVAEMDSLPCPDVADAVVAAVQRGDTGYTDAFTTAEYVAA